MIELINSDIFKVACDGLAHQTNCRGKWGAGIAKEIKKRFPRAFVVDSMTLVNDPKKLGTFNYSAPSDDQDKYIFNLAGQFNYGRNQQYTDYNALYQSMESLKDFILKMGFDKQFILAMPYGLGAGLGGGDWKKVYSIISYVFKDEEKIKVLICKNEK